MIEMGEICNFCNGLLSPTFSGFVLKIKEMCCIYKLSFSLPHLEAKKRGLTERKQSHSLMISKETRLLNIGIIIVHINNVL